MGKLILAENLTPDLILSSTAKRASKTAQAVAENCGYDGKVDWVDDFYPGWPADYLRVLSELPDGVQRVMVVGHNPGLEEFLRLLVGEAGTGGYRSPEHLSSVNYSGTARILSGTLPTAALAQVDLPLESWQDLTASTRGKLVRVLRASEKDK